MGHELPRQELRVVAVVLLALVRRGLLHLGHRARDAVNAELAQLSYQVEPRDTGFVDGLRGAEPGYPARDFRGRVPEPPRADLPGNRIERDGGDRACVNIEAN